MTRQIVLAGLASLIGLIWTQNVGIGTSMPHPSARLDVVDTERGILIPRMTTAERDAITNPARSLLIYNTDCDVYQYYVPGTGWVTILNSGISSGGGGGGSLTALPPTGVGSNGYTAHWTPVPGATGYTIRTYNNCSGASPTLVNITTVSGGLISSAFVAVSIPCNADMCYEVLATVTTGTACGSSPSQLVSNRVPIPPRAFALSCNAPNTWTQISAGPIPPPARNNHVIIAHNEYIYMGFGDDGACLNDWWRWDLCTGNWQQLASPPTTIGGLPFIFSIGNYIYVGGGGHICNAYNSAVYRYDPANNTWTAVAPLPAGRWGAVGASDGTYGYVACGVVGGTRTNQILRYDPVANTWTGLTTYPAGPREAPFMVYHAGRLWIGTGRSAGNTCTNEFYSYDIATGTWTAHAPYPRTEYEGWAAAYNGKIYVTGGVTPCCCTCTNIFYYYDIATNTWSTMAPFPGGNRNDLHLVELNGFLYGGLGHDCGNPLSYSRDWRAYCPY